jgi:anaerobic ribonucleoside-triphosphate reductase activating protein
VLTGLRTCLRGDVLLYTGHPWEEVVSEMQDLHTLVDAAITDPYLPSAGQTLALRGSDNQRLHCLTPLGEERYGHLRFAAEDGVKPSFDVLVDGQGDVWLAGIPRPRDLSRLASFLAAHGFTGTTSEDLPREGL